MAISDSTYVEITTNGSNAILRKLTDDKAVLLYSDYVPATNVFSGVIIDNSGTIPSVGAANEIWDGEDVSGNPDMWVISSTKIVMCCNDLAGDSDVKMRTVSISGDLMTEQTEATVEAITGLDISMAMISGGTGLVAYRNSSGSAHRLCRFTITGDTVSPGTPQAHGTDTVARPLGMCKLDASRVFYMYHISGNDIKFQIIDISSGITEGAPVFLDDGGRNREVDWLETARHPCVKVDTNKVFCHWKDDGDTPHSNVGVIVNCGIGTTINGFGTELEFISSSTAHVTGSPDVLAADTLAVMYTDASLAGVIETVAVSGDTLTQNGDSISTSTTPEEVAPQHALVSTNLAEGEGVLILQENADATTLSVSKITGLPAQVSTNEFRYLGLSSDHTNLYVTQQNGGTLQFTYCDLSTLTAAGTSSFGTAAYADIDTHTYGVYPVAKPNEEQVVYLRGRDGNDLQVQYNNLDGTLGWVDVGPGTATWAVDKFAVALTPDPLRSNDVTVAFSDDDIYQTTQGTQTWTKLGDASTGLRAGMRFSTSNNEHLVGGTAGGSVFYTPNWGVSFSDVSGTALGTINWIEESR